MTDNLPLADDGLIFALDIGTRSVVGIAGRSEGDVFVVEAHAAEPHSKRAMIDGQIEDIEQVARVAGKVKAQIESSLGLRLGRVSVAAAGRALKTCRAQAQAALPAGTPVTPQSVYQLENSAINEARRQLETDLNDIPYYCVGHSVVRYTLDGYPLSTLLGHKGGAAGVEIIATFLPTEVVESLRRCMELLDLEIDTLTLEPIAAVRAVVPPDIRLLNLALVDVGAGTSDIALSRDGAVAGYTMATVAGDEVTEAIIRSLLVDFDTAESVKMALEQFAPIYYTDILGFEHEPGPREVLQVIEPAVDNLAQVIAGKITDANGGPPQAVFLVGGGSRTPGLAVKLTEKLGLEPNRVAAAGFNFSGRVLNEGSDLDGPEYATPVGIALTAAASAETESTTVTINGRRVRLFIGQTASVMDALLIGGYRYSDLMGRNGRSLTFTLNGRRTVLRGGPYTAAELTVNGRPASLSTPVENGDAIGIVPAASGADAAAGVGDYADGEGPITVTLNGRRLAAGFVALVDGVPVLPDTPIREQDAVEVYLVRTVGELCEAAGIDTAGAEITVNGKKRGPAADLRDGDAVECLVPGDGPDKAPARPLEAGASSEPLAPAPAANGAEADAAGTPPPALQPPVPALSAPKAAVLQPPAASPKPAPVAGAGRPAAQEEAAGAPAAEAPPAARPAAQTLRIELNGKMVMLPPKPDGEPHRLFDMLALVDIDPQKPQGEVKTLVNGVKATYLQELASGDTVEIGWSRGT